MPKFTPVDKNTMPGLILNRIHEIMLIASPYDSFVLEKDGGLTEQILYQYTGMNLGYAPRIWRAETAATALNRLKNQQIDLVLVMMRIADMDPVSIATQIKKMNPDLPIVLLAFDESEIKQLPENFKDTAFDHVFIWSGNANVFLAIVKQLEDKMNIERDVRIGGVRCIIVIEDRPRFYSTILPLVYKEITANIRRLMDSSLTDTERLLHMRVRPKILLCTTFEEAQDYFQKYQNHTLGIISDIRFPRNGIHNPDAGKEFVRWARKMDPSIPILLQSTYEINAQLAKDLHVNFVHKYSKTLLNELRKFIVTNFGFGDFIFKMPNDEVVAQAKDLLELKNALETVSQKSLGYHATSNHFSNWLAARGEMFLASKIRRIKYKEFEDKDDHRRLLVQLVADTIAMKKQSAVAENSTDHFDVNKNFIRLCSGSIGGKARGLAFSNSLLDNRKLAEEFPRVRIRVPQAFVIATSEFDRFMNDNDLWERALATKSNQRIDLLFQKAELSPAIKKSLKAIIDKIPYPLAVRSSSLLEDSQYQPLAGMYATYMLPNHDKRKTVRFQQLCTAIKKVYASMFHKEAMSMINSSIHTIEEEKMAVIIMELVGQEFDSRYYPTISGAVQSFNYYPVSYMAREEGVAFIALGLGRTVAEGEKSLRFSPRYPAILPQYYSIKTTLNNSQNSFYALNLNKEPADLLNGETNNLDKYDLRVAEDDKVLSWAASVVSNEDNLLRHSLKHKGPRVITFAPILKFGLFPLADILNKFIQLGKQALGCEVEIEFAVNLYKDGRPPEFCLLQIKPMVLVIAEETSHDLDLSPDNVVCRSSLTLGNGQFKDIRDIIMVVTDSFDAANSKHIAADIELLNKSIKKNTPYILIGPGRWGTADPWLGIPVKWQQISGARVIIEVGLPEYPVDPSFGSHFFHNVTSMRLGYFTVNHKIKTDVFDEEWFNSLQVKKKMKYSKWLQSVKPLPVLIDGQTGIGHILKPQPEKIELMDEHETSGI